MKIDKFGRISIDKQMAFDLLYRGQLKSLENVAFEDDINQYNQAVDTNADRIPKLKPLENLEISIEEFDKENQVHWFMPKNYCPDLLERLYDRCVTEEQKNRVSQELDLYMKNNMIDLLFYLKYLVDTMRTNKIVWGVGRGSSVASYVLFLIGVHKIDSIKYNLDIHEFLK